MGITRGCIVYVFFRPYIDLRRSTCPSQPVSLPTKIVIFFAARRRRRCFALYIAFDGGGGGAQHGREK